MSKARTLGDLVSTGAVLADGTIDAAEIGNLTLPSGGDIVGTTATQTLTNKTIDYTANTITNLPQTNPAGSTGQVQYNNAGSFGALSDGTAGQVLTSAGAGAAPTWADAGGGGAWTFLGSVTASSSASVELSGMFTSTYDAYVIVAEKIAPATNNVTLQMQWKENGAYVSSYCFFTVTGTNSTSSTYTASNGTGSGSSNFQILSGLANTYSYGGFVLYLYTPSLSAADTPKHMNWTGSVMGLASGSTAAINCNGAGCFFSQGATQAVKFFASSGNLTTGTFRVYGISNS